MSSVQATKTKAFTLKGSAQVVAEFFGYSINSILYQRGIYDPDTFTTVTKYGLRMHITTDEALSSYLKQILKQLAAWLATGDIKKLVLIFQEIDSQEIIERWVFDVETDEEACKDNTISREKDPKEVQKEISAIIRQITASVTFLPIIEKSSTFDILVYTKNDTESPQTWENSDPHYIVDANEVKLRSFSTKIHTVHTSVVYKADDE